MLGRVVEFALTQRLFVSLAALALVGSGWLAFQDTPIDAFPDVSTTQVKIILRAPGMTPEEVESRITALVEIEMLGIPRQTTLRSVTKYALADITVDFEEGTDIYWARQQVAERLSGLWNALPVGAEGGVAPMTTPLGEMFMFTVEGGALDLGERRALLDWVIRPALRSVAGVADVNALGGEVATFEVVPRAPAMIASRVELHELHEAIAKNNRNDGAGRLVDGEEVLLVRSEGRVRTLDDLRSIVLRSDATEPIRVGDVADVRIGSLARYGVVTRDGVGEAVQGLVLGLRGANAREVVAAVRSRLDELAPALPPGVHVEIFYDRGDLVDRAVSTVETALLGAVALVIVVLVAFLANARAALTVALVLPLTVLGTFLWMRLLGLSANLMSLGGLAIATGMLVDPAVVVIENVVSHLGKDSSARLPRLHVIYRAVREVAAPVSAGTLIIVLVFLPLLTLEGLEGKLFAPVALTIVSALVTALVLSLAVLPALASMLIRNVSSEGPRFMRHLERGYLQVLELVLRNARTALLASAGLLAVAGLVYGQVGKIFLPTLDEGNVIVQLEKLPSISLESSRDFDLRFERALLERVPEVVGVVARTGADEIGLDPMGLNQTDAFLVLRPKDEWRFASTEALLDEIREVMQLFPGIAYGFTQPIDMRVSEMLTGVRGDVAVKIFGYDLERLDEIATFVARTLQSTPGAEDVFRTRTEGAEYMQVDFDLMAAGRLGLSVDDLQHRLRAMLEGVRIGTVFDDMRRIPLMLRSPESVRDSPFDFEHLMLSSFTQEPIPLTLVADVSRIEGPVQINREGASRLAVVTANVRGRDLVGFVEDAQSRVAAAVALEPGYRIEWGGQFENQQRAARRLALVMPVGLGLIFLILFSTFRSVAQAALVLANIPLALVGGILSLWAFGEYLSVPATIGFVALLGIAVLNGVVLVTTFNQLRDEGVPLDDAIRDGATRRLRPVLMTASSTALGLLPLLAATGPGSELQRPLAIVVIGGLVSSTALTLVLLPMLYRRLRIWQEGGRAS